MPIAQNRKRLRCVGILCCHCLRNIAFYLAGFKDGKLIRDDQFWRTVNGNFLDIAVLEWCKLFADFKKGKQHWNKVVRNPDAFREGLWSAIAMDANQFAEYLKIMKDYRDTFIAHLDDEDVMHIPLMEPARKSVIYLFDYLRANEEYCNCFHDAPESAEGYYNELLTINND